MSGKSVGQFRPLSDAAVAGKIPDWVAKKGPVTYVEAPNPIPLALRPSTYRNVATHTIAKEELRIISRPLWLNALYCVGVFAVLSAVCEIGLVVSGRPSVFQLRREHHTLMKDSGLLDKTVSASDRNAQLHAATETLQGRMFHYNTLKVHEQVASCE